MTGVVSREHARATYLTGAAGVLMIAIAAVMMIVAAPGQAAPPAGVGANQAAAAQVAMDVCHRFTSRSDSATVRACLAGPSAASAWADA